jgi:two-component system chemotaxis response regulator CheY
MKKKILLVDDEEEILVSVSDYLSSLNFDVINGRNGEEAVELFEKEKPDLVLLDVRMPKKDGYQAYFDIKDRHKDAKIMLMSAYPIENALYEKIKNQEMIYFLNKPFTTEALKDMIMELI